MATTMPTRLITTALRSTRRRTLAAATMATLCATALSACGQASSPAATTGPVSVGISLSLSGDFADPGRAALRGYQLWADSVNGGGGILGRRLQLTVLDDHSDPARAARNYRTLITRDKVNLVLGPF